MTNSILNKIKTVLVSDINKKTSTHNYKTSEINEILPFEIEVSSEYKIAFRVLELGCPLVFLTGKAGTGKSTFIQYFRSKTNKRIAVVAPTGVAALNIRGQTIHSFFRFPPRIIDTDDIKRVFNKILYEKLEILIIDEASMLRVDLLDCIDLFLRKNSKSPQLPFGGVQLVLVGDLFQLPPVAPKEEWEILESRGYETPYFFSAKCIQFCRLAFIELTKIYRQENRYFIQLLNCIREGINPTDTIHKINSHCYRETYQNSSNSDITLTCTNKKASEINYSKLNTLPTQEYTYEGTITGDFNIQRNKLPSPFLLRLKVGSQIMFTKNDGRRRWVNGTLGNISKLSSDKIWVTVEKKLYDVEKVSWETLKYEYDKHEDKIVTKVKGRYTQFPLILAWAITIHKSQGKTLKNVCIDLGDGAFDFGQTYVALSRCPTINDIKLKKPLNMNDVKVDSKIIEVYSYLREHTTSAANTG